jgi:16S rRNA (adenine1518-N6/adenine1519-N6)-dimethyltransferase
LIPNVRDLLRQYEIRPRKSLGQHFLTESAYLSLIVAAADLTPSDVVLEVGPGPGVLTGPLAAAAGQVIAVELDERFRSILAEQFADRPNLRIVDGDILQLDPSALLGDAGATGRRGDYKVVANLPYYITSAVLRHLLEAPLKPALLVVMLQREVGERILAAPGDLSILAISIQLYSTPSPVAIVPREAFYPRPKVDSMVLRLDVHERPPVGLPPSGAGGFMRVVKAGFGQKRKQLHNSVSAGLQIEPSDCAQAMLDVGIDPRRRAQTLTLEEWSSLATELAARGYL